MPTQSPTDDAELKSDLMHVAGRPSIVSYGTRIALVMALGLSVLAVGTIVGYFVRPLMSDHTPLVNQRPSAPALPAAVANPRPQRLSEEEFEAIEQWVSFLTTMDEVHRILAEPETLTDSADRLQVTAANNRLASRKIRSAVATTLVAQHLQSGSKLDEAVADGRAFGERMLAALDQPDVSQAAALVDTTWPELPVATEKVAQAAAMRLTASQRQQLKQHLVRSFLGLANRPKRGTFAPETSARILLNVLG